MLNPTLCVKDSHVEIVSVRIPGILSIRACARHGKESEETDVLLSILDRAVITGNDQPQALEPVSLKKSGARRMSHNESILGLVEHEAALSHLRKHEKKERKARPRHFSPSSGLEALGKDGGTQKMFPPFEEAVVRDSSF